MRRARHFVSTFPGYKNPVCRAQSVSCHTAFSAFHPGTASSHSSLKRTLFTRFYRSPPATWLALLLLLPIRRFLPAIPASPCSRILILPEWPASLIWKKTPPLIFH